MKQRNELLSLRRDRLALLAGGVSAPLVPALAVSWFVSASGGGIEATGLLGFWTYAVGLLAVGWFVMSGYGSELLRWLAGE